MVKLFYVFLWIWDGLMEKIDVVIIGAGASGLMCAMEAGRRGRRVLVLDHAKEAGNKIRVSGGGKSNFTNYEVGAEHYISNNPHFCKSALSRFTQWDFLGLLESHGISFSERAHGQLFCDESSEAIIKMLLTELEDGGVTIRMDAKIEEIEKEAAHNFKIRTTKGDFSCHSIVIASGGLSIPTLGASPFGYKVAEQFGVEVRPTSAGLVPFTLQPKDKERFAKLSGIAVEGIVSNKEKTFRENILFTHRGLSGPAILQLSSYWKPGEEILINLLPDIDLITRLKSLKEERPKLKIKTALAVYLPKRLVAALFSDELLEKQLQVISYSEIEEITAAIQKLIIKPGGTEGYRTAEVTVGGVDCDEISSKSFECNKVPGLYFIGEVLDVTGWLGGYNLQWAWSSGWCAGQYV